MSNVMISGYELRAPQKEEIDLFYSWDDLRESSCVGHLRGDFGASGNEFWTSWEPHVRNDLNNTCFKLEFDSIVNALRENDGPLSSRTKMDAFCYHHQENKIAEGSCFVPNSYGFVVETEAFSYYLRFAPMRGNYDLYIYCYAKDALKVVMKQNMEEKK